MDDLERRIRAARPESGHRELGLTDRGRRELIQLTTADSPAPSRISRQRVNNRFMMVVAASIAFVIVAAVSLNVIFPTAHAYAATPQVLEASPIAQDPGVLLSEIGRNAKLREDQPTDITAPTTISAQVWTLTAVSDGEALATNVVALEYAVSVAPDGAVRQVVTAGESVDGAGNPVHEGVPAVGEPISEDDWVAGDQALRFNEPFPVNSDEVGDYLARAYGSSERPDTALAIRSVADLMMKRVLSPEQEAALLDYFSHAPDIRVVGQVTDRLGRPAIAFAAKHTDNPSYEEYLIVSRDSGLILAVETLYVAEGRSDIPSPSVTSYFAWRR